MNGYRLKAFRVNHNVLCYGYTMEIDRAGKFQLDKAEALGIERRYWNKLQKGETLELDGKIYTPDMVMGEARKGLKVTYCTDTRLRRHCKACGRFGSFYLRRHVRGAGKER